MKLFATVTVSLLVGCATMQERCRQAGWSTNDEVARCVERTQDRQRQWIHDHPPQFNVQQNNNVTCTTNAGITQCW